MARVQCVRAAIAAVVSSSCLVLMLLVPTGASAASRTFEFTEHQPASATPNLCNNDLVNLSGDIHVRITTTTLSNGGTTVKSAMNARDLRGERILDPESPLQPMRYRGQDSNNEFTYFAPPPYPATYSQTHWTRLVPEGNAPSMYLVVVLRLILAADGGVSVPVIERMYLTCTQPKCSSRRH